MARAFGSYPKCHRFKSSYRYHRYKVSLKYLGTGCNSGRWVACCFSEILYSLRPVGQAVKTRPFHGCNMGSIPVRVIKNSPQLRLGTVFLLPYEELLRRRPPPAAETGSRSRASGRRGQAPPKGRSQMRVPRPGTGRRAAACNQQSSGLLVSPREIPTGHQKRLPPKGAGAFSLLPKSIGLPVRESNSSSGRPASRPVRTVRWTVRKSAGDSLDFQEHSGRPAGRPYTWWGVRSLPGMVHPAGSFAAGSRPRPTGYRERYMLIVHVTVGCRGRVYAARWRKW